MNNQVSKSTTILYVVFNLASEYYGVDIRDIYRVTPIKALTRVPGTPTLLKGIVNFRGRLVPVVDLRKGLGLQATRLTEESRIIIASIAGEDIGLIVDAVTGVLPIALSSIEPVFTSSKRTGYLSGIARLAFRQVWLLDLDRLFTAFSGHITAVPISNEPTPVR